MTFPRVDPHRSQGGNGRVSTLERLIGTVIVSAAAGVVQLITPFRQIATSDSPPQPSDLAGGMAGAINLFTVAIGCGGIGLALVIAAFVLRRRANK